MNSSVRQDTCGLAVNYIRGFGETCPEDDCTFVDCDSFGTKCSKLSVCYDYIGNAMTAAAVDAIAACTTHEYSADTVAGVTGFWARTSDQLFGALKRIQGQCSPAPVRTRAPPVHANTTTPAGLQLTRTPIARTTPATMATTHTSTTKSKYWARILFPTANASQIFAATANTEAFKAAVHKMLTELDGILSRDVLYINLFQMTVNDVQTTGSNTRAPSNVTPGVASRARRAAASNRKGVGAEVGLSNQRAVTMIQSSSSDDKLVVYYNGKSYSGKSEDSSSPEDTGSRGVLVGGAYGTLLRVYHPCLHISLPNCIFPPFAPTTVSRGASRQFVLVLLSFPLLAHANGAAELAHALRVHGPNVSVFVPSWLKACACHALLLFSYV